MKFLFLISGITVAFSQLVISPNVFANEPPIMEMEMVGDMNRLNSRPPATTRSDTGFNIKYFYRHEGSDQIEPLTNNHILYSGDDYQIRFSSRQTSYVYIFQRDSSSNIYRLFPMKSFKGVTMNQFNPVQPGITYIVPGKHKWFYLDEQIGKETIYFIASEQPKPELDNPTGPPQLRQLLKKCEDCVNILRFWHR